MASACDPAVYAALERAAANIADFHRRQLQQSWLDTRPDGTIVGQRIRGLDRVGIYVPGGTAAYPSSVLMNAIPARIAGVKAVSYTHLFPAADATSRTPVARDETR